MSVTLGVNIDHIATLRQQRREAHPDPVAAALVAQKAGADSIVAHLREDRRHIQDHDLVRLKRALKIPLAMEMAATEEMVDIACRLRPRRVCLVPERRQELTTEGGLNVRAYQRRLSARIARLRQRGIEVSLFVDPDPEQIRASHAVGAEIVELHTGDYARARGQARGRALKSLEQAARVAAEVGLALHAGHGLDYQNTPAVAALPKMRELNIGFAIIGHALDVGLAQAVKEMKEILACAA